MDTKPYLLIVAMLCSFPAIAETTRTITCPPALDRCYYEEKPVVPMPNLGTLIQKLMSICMSLEPLSTVVIEGKTVVLPPGHSTAPDYDDVMNRRKPYRWNRNGYCYQFVFSMAVKDFCGGISSLNKYIRWVCGDDFLTRALVKDPAYILYGQYIDTLGRK